MTAYCPVCTAARWGAGGCAGQGSALQQVLPGGVPQLLDGDMGVGGGQRAGGALVAVGCLRGRR